MVGLPVVLGQGKEKVLGEVVEAELLAGPGQSVDLDSGLDGGIHQELLESAVFLHGLSQLFLREEKYQ